MSDNTQDTPQPEQTKAERALFQLDFMLMMLQCGREQEALAAYKNCHELLEELVEGGA